MGSYRFIYIYIIVGRAGIHLTKIPKTVIRIFKISVSVSVSVRIYESGQAGGRAGRLDWSGGLGSTVFLPTPFTQSQGVKSR